MANKKFVGTRLGQKMHGDTKLGSSAKNKIKKFQSFNENKRKKFDAPRLDPGAFSGVINYNNVRRSKNLSFFAEMIYFSVENYRIKCMKISACSANLHHRREKLRIWPKCQKIKFFRGKKEYFFQNYEGWQLLAMQ